MSDEDPDSGRSDTLPAAVVDRVRRLTSQARDAVDEREQAAYLQERDGLLESHQFTCRIREDGSGDTLVCYPSDWIEGGVVQMAEIDDPDRAVERSLSQSVAGSEEWETIASMNQEIADIVYERHGVVHGATAEAFADFMSNHYAKPIESVTPTELDEFRTEYFPRNAWPSDEQMAVMEESIRLTLEIAESA